MIRAERDKPVSIGWNVLASFTVKQANDRAVKETDFDTTVSPITMVHA